MSGDDKSHPTESVKSAFALQRRIRISAAEEIVALKAMKPVAEKATAMNKAFDECAEFESDLKRKYKRAPQIRGKATGPEDLATRMIVEGRLVRVTKAEVAKDETLRKEKETSSGALYHEIEAGVKKREASRRIELIAKDNGVHPEQVMGIIGECIAQDVREAAKKDKRKESVPADKGVKEKEADPKATSMKVGNGISHTGGTPPKTARTERNMVSALQQYCVAGNQEDAVPQVNAGALDAGVVNGASVRPKGGHGRARSNTDGQSL